MKSKKLLLSGGEKVKRFDDFIVFGRYVGLFCFVCEFVILSQCATMFYFVYAGAAPPTETLVCNGDERTLALTNHAKCNLVRIGNCTQPKIDYQFKSLHVEFNLFCDLAKTVKNVISLQMIGVLVGSVIFGQLSDSFGRKTTLLFGLIGCSLTQIISAFAPTLGWFTGVRIAAGFFLGGSIAVFNVFWVENLPTKSRLWISMLITWSPNMAPIALIAFYSESWDAFSITLGSIMLVAAILLALFVHESPRWLIQKGKIAEARIVMQKVFKMDRRPESGFDELEKVLIYEHELLQKQRAKGKHYYYYHLFSTPWLTMITIILSFTFLSISIINYGIMFNFEQMSGSIYMNMVYTGLIRWISNLTFAWLDYRYKWCGRKFVHWFGLLFIVLPLALVILAHYWNLSTQLSLYIRLSILVAVSMTSQIYISATILSNELFPTPIRNLAFSFQSLFNRFGVVLSPFVFYLVDYWVALPFVVMCITASIDIVTWHFLLPETKNQPMVEHMPKTKKRNMEKELRLVSNAA
ncbi:unnamed protein product, partial [Mesorhabditis belari]|uniref:Major facilitator superfamily (MFS) profile domain-containing protein n=1 Tax=Mesorhabditis belari TaxID=2138241 RepID=A0AAF3EL70_9BILA